MLKRPLLALLLGLLGPALAHAQALPPAGAVAPVVDSLARAFLAEGATPSVAIGLVRGADTIALRAWGSADLEHAVPASATSVYRIGSVTKQFTAAAVMQLVEQGKIRLDEAISTYLTALPAAWQPVTVRQLLNHTSGIPSYTGAGEVWRKQWGVELPPESLLALTAGDTMWFQPGTGWRYDNTGYVLLGMLIEKVAGRPWGSDLQERLLGPLGLAQTCNCMTEPLIPQRVRGYQKQAGNWANAPYLAMSQPYAAGAMCSTVGDLVRWNRALHTGRVVSAESYRLMTTPEGPAAGSNQYGFGLTRAKMGERDVIEHGGGIHGFTTANAWVPSAELSITVLTNSGSARADELMRQLARAALGVPLTRPPTVQPLAAADRARYTGVYALQLPNGARDFTIAEAADGLTAQLVGQGPIPLLHYGNHTFGASFDPSLRLTFTLDGGHATKLTLAQGGGSFEGARK